MLRFVWLVVMMAMSAVAFAAPTDLTPVPDRWHPLVHGVWVAGPGDTVATICYYHDDEQAIAPNPHSGDRCDEVPLDGALRPVYVDLPSEGPVRGISKWAVADTRWGMQDLSVYVPRPPDAPAE